MLLKIHKRVCTNYIQYFKKKLHTSLENVILKGLEKLLTEKTFCNKK